MLETAMGSFSIWHWIIVIGLILVLFGRGKVSELMGDVAKGIKSFKKGMADDDQVADEPRVITREPVQPVTADRAENHTKVS
jgi:sec-independent protein translocase protein TatA